MLDLQRNISLDHTAVPDCLDDGLEMGKAMEQISPPIGDMRYELARARTFENRWPADGSGEKLASYGFYRLRDGTVKCAFCGLENGLYVPAEDVKFRHWQFARNYCRFLKGEDVGNVTADTTSCVRNDNALNKRRMDSVGGGSNPRTEQSRLLRATPVNLPPLAPLHGNHSSAFVNSSPATIHPEEASPPRHTLPSASAARHTHSQQPAASQHHSHPPPSASPSSELHHQAASPARTKTTTPFPLNTVIPPPTATPPPPPPPPPPPSDHAVPTMTWVDIIRTARYPQMAAFQARLDTLSTWPLVKPTPEELARAGLFHVKCRSTRKTSRSGLEVWGSGESGTPASPLLNGGIVSGRTLSSRRGCVDSVKCFWCGERFHRWQKTDDALLEHARLSPACRYVTRLVGQQLHNDVVNAASAGVGDRFFTGENQPSSATPPRATTTTTTTTTATTTIPSSRHDLDDIMESPPVQTVLQMGFPRRLIRDLLSQNSHRLTAETLCHLALQAVQGASAAQRTAQDTEGPVPGTDRPVPGTDRPVPGTERSLPGDRVKETAHVGPGRNDGGPSRFLVDENQQTDLTRPKSSGEEPTAPPLVPSAPFLLDLSGHRERVMCKVCSEAEVKVTFRPCNHLVCCSQCAVLFTTCPVCEHPIEDTLTTYLS